MLYIEERLANGILAGSEWHTGEPMPLITGNVVTFQADGDELEVILDAIRERAVVNQ